MGLHCSIQHSMDPHSHSEIAHSSLIGWGRWPWFIMPNWSQSCTIHLADDPGFAQWCGITYTIIRALASDLLASSICLETHEYTYVTPHVIWSTIGYYKGPPRCPLLLRVHLFFMAHMDLIRPLRGPMTCIDYYLTSWEPYFFIYELVWWACHQKLNY